MKIYSCDQVFIAFGAVFLLILHDLIQKTYDDLMTHVQPLKGLHRDWSKFKSRFYDDEEEIPAQ